MAPKFSGRRRNRPILVLGCGSIGRRHMRNLAALGCAPVGFDPDAGRRKWVESNLGVPTVGSLEDGWQKAPEAAWICTPPVSHAGLALSALSRGIPCFIEKPLTATLAETQSIERMSRKTGLPIAVGYQLRFHPALQWLKRQVEARRWGRLLFLRAEVGQYLPDWRPWQDFRKSYTARRDLGGGIILDASHEIDLARWMGGDISSVYCSAARLSGLGLNVEDTAAIVLNFESGALGEVHLDMVQRSYRRNLQLVFERGTAIWDFPAATLKSYSARSKRWTLRRFLLDPNEMYVREARAFLGRLAGASRNGYLPAREGVRTLAVVAAAQKSARSRRMERVEGV